MKKRDDSVPELSPGNNCVSCSDKVILEAFSKSADMSTGEFVAAEFMPKETGEYAFACPMGMFHGRLIVE